MKLGLTILIAVCCVAALDGGASRAVFESSKAATRPATGPAFERSSQLITQVYFNDFDDTPAGTEWSSRNVGFTEKGDRPYLGDFLPNKEPVTLTLGDLPAHKLVRISFDLFLKKSWDGTSPEWGDTIWDMQLDDFRSLIHTTFCNCAFFANNNQQAFPDTYPARTHLAWTGATENRSLGAMQSWGGPDNTFDTSSVYHLSLTFPHLADKVVFAFSSKMKGDVNKPFGLTNVRVQTLSDFARHTNAEFTRMWADLGSAHYPTFFTAQWDLIASGDAAVAFLADHINERDDLSDQEIRDVINEYRKTHGLHTEDLIQTLVMQGSAAVSPIDDALGGQNLSDSQKGMLGFCKAFIARYPQSATELRLQRAIQLLHVIHTDAAMKLAEQAGK